jgi:sugar/nucleoside kinase (ribokinase family)
MQKKGESQRLLQRLPAPGRAFDVIAVGENSLDILVSLPGGQAASALVGCARLGCRTQYLGVFGDDEHGRSVERALRAEGVDTRSCVTARASNRSAFIVVDPSAGTRAVLWRRDPALKWPDTSAFGGRVTRARALLVDTSDMEAAIAAATAARKGGVPVVLDIDRTEQGVDDLLKNVDVLVAAEGFPEAHTGATSMGAAMRQLRNHYRAAIVVVTLGASGAISWDGEMEVQSAGFEVPVVDPTGAGDAFRAGFLAAWLFGTSSLSDLLDFANATAALKCRAIGAQTGLPSRAEVLGLLTDRTIRRSNQAGSATEAGHP